MPVGPHLAKVPERVLGLSAEDDKKSIRKVSRKDQQGQEHPVDPGENKRAEFHIRLHPGMV